MKTKAFLKIGIILIVGALFLFTSTLFANNGKKLALIIAVANYPSEGGWSQISSDQDIQLIEATLKAQGFKSEDIVVIIDEQANKEGILKALSDLKDKVNKDDIVVIHYSGHGQQIMDNNNDEVDGFDEALIPFDAHIQFKKGTYTGENHLRDEELGSILNDISHKVGSNGNLLVILDACHSGTGTRGFGKCRGTAQRFESKGYNPTIKEQEQESSLMEIPKSRGGDDSANAPIIVISGALQNELNYEYQDDNGKYYGSLSYAISKILASADSDMTYRALFDLIELEMSVLAPRQTPQIEGDLDRKILGGAAVDQTPYFMVNKYFDENNCSLKAGLLIGLSDSSVVEFYDINTADPSKAEAKSIGTIVNSSAIECDVVLTKPLSEEEVMNSWVFVKSQNYGRQKIGVKINIDKNKDLKKAIIDSLKSLETIRIVDENSELIIDEVDNTRSANSYELLSFS